MVIGAKVACCVSSAHLPRTTIPHLAAIGVWISDVVRSLEKLFENPTKWSCLGNAEGTF
jgi:hypothetical protein